MKTLYTAMGGLFLALGMVGIFVPLLPTTPFLLLAAWMYCRSSPRMHGWLMIHPRFGPYIRNYRDKKAISLHGKAVSLALLWITIGICIFFVADPLWLKLLLAVILAGVSWHILSFRTLRHEEDVRFIRLTGMAREERIAAESNNLQLDYTTILPETGDTVPKTVSGQELYLVRAGSREAGYVWMELNGRHLVVRSLSLQKSGAADRYATEVLTFLEHYCRCYGVGKITVQLWGIDRQWLAPLYENGFRIKEDCSCNGELPRKEQHTSMEKRLDDLPKISVD